MSTHDSLIHTVNLKWTKHERVRVFQHIRTLLTTQHWPSCTSQIRDTFIALSAVNHESTRRIAATLIQRMYLNHLYHPLHAWHRRRAKELCDDVSRMAMSLTAASLA